MCKFQVISKRKAPWYSQECQETLMQREKLQNGWKILEDKVKSKVRIMVSKLCKLLHGFTYQNEIERH